MASCSLDTLDRAARARAWEALRADALVSERHTDAGSFSVFEARDDVPARLEALIEAEHDCCSHLRFDVTQEAGRITVAVSGQRSRPLTDRRAHSTSSSGSATTSGGTS